MSGVALRVISAPATAFEGEAEAVPLPCLLYTSADAITWTAENGIFAGYGKDKFGPDDPITREQLAAIFYRYADYKGYDLC